MTGSPDRRTFFKSAAGLVAAGCAQSVLTSRGRAAADRPPNIVLLHADDLGWTDLACFGSGYYETPNSDRLCAEGMKFTNAYAAAANCAPSRACMLSGQYVPRHGVYTVGGKRRFDSNDKLLKWHERKLLAPENASGLSPDKLTFAEALKSAGYTCAVFGKWHLGRSEGQLPEDQGFDESVLMAASRHFKFSTDPPPAEPPPEDAYLSDYMTDQALAFIESSRDRPFLLYLPDFLVHVPLEAKPELVEKYQGKEPVEGHLNPVYAAMIEALDHSFGRVVTKLDELGLSENTLVMLFSDNGGVGSAKDRGLNKGGKLTSNYPLRGMKGMLYEGGIRVPMVARWPGVIEAGSVCDEPVHGVDVFPTFLDVAGAGRPGSHLLDGESLLPVMSGRAERLARDDIFWFMPGYLPGRQAPANVIRSGDWKLIENFEDGTLELFNLRDDIGETKDLASEQPDRANELHGKLKRWREETGAKIPDRNPAFDPQNEGKW